MEVVLNPANRMETADELCFSLRETSDQHLNFKSRIYKNSSKGENQKNAEKL